MSVPSCGQRRHQVVYGEERVEPHTSTSRRSLVLGPSRGGVRDLVACQPAGRATGLCPSRSRTEEMLLSCVNRLGGPPASVGNVLGRRRCCYLMRAYRYALSPSHLYDGIVPHGYGCGERSSGSALFEHDHGSTVRCPGVHIGGDSGHRDLAFGAPVRNDIFDLGCALGARPSARVPRHADTRWGVRGPLCAGRVCDHSSLCVLSSCATAQ